MRSRFYGDIQALFGVSMEIGHGEAVAVIGANGAGKSALLRTIAGLFRARPEAVVFEGAPIGGVPAYAVAARGIALVPEGRGLFASLSVEENLLVGGQLGRRGRGICSAIFELFPVLAERALSQHGIVRRPAADGRDRARADVEPEIAAVRRDQPRPGADRGARHLCAAPAILGEGTSIVLVEQDIVQALKAAARVYCLQEGRVALTGAAKDLTREQIAAAYFGV